MAMFYGRHGFELEKYYPYRAKSYICPYEPIKINQFKAGLIRLTERDGSMVIIDYGDFKEALKTTLIAVGVAFPVQVFLHYSHGIYDGHDCNIDNSWHSMTIVGHGIENNVEYWIMRNSYGPYWGEEGYFRMDVNANKSCYADQAIGFILMPQEGSEIFNLNGNTQYEPSFVKQRYYDFLSNRSIPLNKIVLPPKKDD